MLRVAMVSLMLGGALMASYGDDGPARTVAQLAEGGAPTIVCFGDSITGAYYHTGSERAWTDMLGIALERLYPGSEPAMINAGISGNTTPAGLARIDRDVISHDPDLVVVMFGINDMSRKTPPEEYREKLSELVERLLAAEAEVVLCTPTLSANFGGHPLETQQAYCAVVREVAAEHSLAVADTHELFASLREDDPQAYALAMSDAVHPNMNGHKLIAETVARAIAGREVDLGDVPPPDVQLSQTLAKGCVGEPVRVVAMPPFDGMVREVLASIPGWSGEVEVVTWPTSASIEELEQWAKAEVRAQKPDLVIVAVPADAVAANDAGYIASYEWILNWSLDFGPGTWDCLPVLPEVTRPVLTEAEQERAAIARTLVAGKDLWPLERAAGDDAATQELLTRFVMQQYERWTGAEGQGE